MRVTLGSPGLMLLTCLDYGGLRRSVGVVELLVRLSVISVVVVVVVATDVWSGDLGVAEPETVAVARRGILYLFGNRLEPPFVFTIYNDTLWVNDYYFMGKPQPEPKREVSGRIQRQVELSDSMWAEVRRLRQQGVSYDSLLSGARRVLLGSAQIDSVRVEKWGLLVWWHGERYQPEHVLISPHPPPPPRPFLERLRSEAKLMTTLLNMGGIEIRGSKFCLSVPARDLAKVEALIEKVKDRGWASEEDERALHAPPGKLEELINPRPLKRRGEEQ